MYHLSNAFVLMLCIALHRMHSHTKCGKSAQYLLAQLYRIHQKRSLKQTATLRYLQDTVHFSFAITIVSSYPPSIWFFLCMHLLDFFSLLLLWLFIFFFFFVCSLHLRLYLYLYLYTMACVFVCLSACMHVCISLR